MSKTLITLKTMLLVTAIAFSQTTQTIKVIVPNATDEVYIMGNQETLGNWNPKQVKMEKTSDYERSISVELSYPAEFKFTKGDWNSEGIIKQLNDNPNLILENEDSKTEIVIKTWMDHIDSDRLGLEYDIDFIDSKFLGNKHMIKIDLPENYSPEKKYPVIYITDGGTDNFDVARGNILALSLSSYQIIPESILVGIVHKKRNEELFNYKSGEYFTEYLFNELVPYIDSKYSTSGFNVMIGHSNGAEYNHHLMLEPDSPFRGFICLSTSFLGKGSKASEMTDFFESYKGKNMYYFVANATNDSPDRIEYGDEIETLFQNTPNEAITFLKNTYEADHVSIVPLSLNDALKFIFKDFRDMSNYPTFADYKNNYRLNIEDAYGIEVAYDLNALDVYLQNLMDAKDAKGFQDYFDFTEEHKLWQNPFTGEPMGLDLANQANQLCYAKINEPCITKYNEAFSEIYKTVEAEMYYGNLEKVIIAYKDEKRFAEAIDFLEMSIDFLANEENPFNNNRQWHLLKMQYFLADISLTNNIKIAKGKSALDYCKNNYLKNKRFSKEDLNHLEG
ncbi:alpha/beta hydrolase-fold protein [Winogradskyella aurantiaca]|uniref:alpha/beta hydrolase-fold protein n=1 Tax=Winogradskyella aurantiaca TaxID=2219558 RepID=UPI000E1D0D8E|nr:alpha/beta hydrolase-fold protein [Winogradskyella aurantiaca]